MNKIKVSIITVCFNSEKTLHETINSVKYQTYENIEYIIIDGYSSDNTLNIIKSNIDVIDYYISENDNGLYDAMNKGIQIASGDIISILNSDDIYASNEVIKDIVEVFNNNKSLDIVFGNIVFYDSNMINPTRVWKSSDFKNKLFLKGWHPPHPALFVTKRGYNICGLYDINYRMCADFEFMLRAFEKKSLSNQFIDLTIVKMRTGGKTTSSLINIIDGNFQIISAFKKNNLKINPIMYLIRRLAPKLYAIFINKLKYNE
jgi:glycosyltransferase involved in cell wall biosynthesis